MIRRGRHFLQIPALLATPAAERIGSSARLVDPVAHAASLLFVVMPCACASQAAAQPHVEPVGHLGDFNELMLSGTLGGVELGLGAAGVPFTRGGVDAALAMLSQGAAVESTAGVSSR